jgi:large subunit ribosomal protein L22
MPDTATKDTPQTKATLKYLRTSAYKVREVLDLIRGLDVEDARHVLMFNERGPAREVLKVLNSAVANADHTLNIPADELKVAVAFADEGPTIKRWRPRARGRATRIRKRTCHITIIVARLTDDELQIRRRKESAAGGGRRRVLPGRRRKAAEEGTPKAAKGKAAEAPEEPEETAPESEVEPEEASVAEPEEVAEPEAVASGDTPEPPGPEEKAARYESLGREEAPAAAEAEEAAADEASAEEEEGKS